MHFTTCQVQPLSRKKFDVTMQKYLRHPPSSEKRVHLTSQRLFIHLPHSYPPTPFLAQLPNHHTNLPPHKPTLVAPLSHSNSAAPQPPATPASIISETMNHIYQAERLEKAATWITAVRRRRDKPRDAGVFFSTSVQCRRRCDISNSAETS